MQPSSLPQLSSATASCQPQPSPPLHHCLASLLCLPTSPNHCLSSIAKAVAVLPLVHSHRFFLSRLGIPIFGSDFWDPHCRQNSDFVFDSKDSSRKIFFDFQCLESQKIGIPILKFGILVPHKKTDTNSSIDTKVHGRKPSPYKMVGELFFPPNLHLLTLIGKQTYIYSHLMENEQ